MRRAVLGETSVRRQNVLAYLRWLHSRVVCAQQRYDFAGLLRSSLGAS